MPVPRSSKSNVSGAPVLLGLVQCHGVDNIDRPRFVALRRHREICVDRRRCNFANREASDSEERIARDLDGDLTACGWSDRLGKRFQSPTAATGCAFTNNSFPAKF